MRLIHPFFPTGFLCLALSIPAFSQFNVNNRIVFTANMNGVQVVPPVSTGARGLVTFNIASDLSSVTIHGVFSGLSGPVTACKIYNGKAGFNGAEFFDLAEGLSGNEIRATLTPLPPDFIKKGLEYKLYLTVQTSAHPDGEIRGQLEVETATHYIALMEGSQAVPSVNTSASGFASIYYQPGDFYAYYTVLANGLSGPVTGVSIKSGQIGTAGTTIITLNASNPSVGQIDLVSAPADFKSKLESQQIAVNIETAAHPSGEIKGQLAPFSPVSFEGFMNGDQAVPPVATSAQGLAVAKLSSDLDSLIYFAAVTGLTPQSARIHTAPPSQTGPIVANMSPSILPNLYFGSVQITPGEAIPFLNGEGYVNITTAAHPDGEIRCQFQSLLRQCFAFDLCGNQEVPPSGSNAIGSAIISVDPLNTHLTYHFIADGLSGPATGAQLEEAAFGESGSLLAPLFLPDPLGSGQFPVDGNFVAKLQSDNTCLNFLTAAFPDGEIRGQVRKELSCEGGSGISDPFVSEWRLFPNPAPESAMLAFFAEKAFEGIIEIYDLTGKPVQAVRRYFDAGRQSLELDLREQPPGLYFVKMNTGKGIIPAIKLVVNH